MRTEFAVAAGCVLGWAAAAAAQQPGFPAQPGYGPPGYSNPQYPPLNPANVMPNVYNPQYQPLSPYLNLLRGGNPGVNYYYGVRPGTVGGAGNFGGSANVAAGGNRGLFFPQLASGPDPFAAPDPDASGPSVLPPAGHPVVFNNTLGYFPGSFGRGSRPGLSGVGANRPATPRR